MSELKVRLYNVLFGDGILIEVPDRDSNGVETIRRILIDVGNAPNKEGGVDTVLPPIVEHVSQSLGGRPLDLYVMTHEHLDHVQGLRYANLKDPLRGRVKQVLPVDYFWFTASSKPGYYDTHEDARKALARARAAYAEIGRRLGLLPAAQRAHLDVIYANNNPNSTTECVAFLKSLAEGKKVSWVYRGIPASQLKHPFKEAKFRVWAPEEDTSVYYGRLQQLSLGTAAGVAETAAPPQPVPPPGVDLGAFDHLVKSRAQGLGDNLMEIDKAANNTSVVFSLEWRGWRLLFTGDAEIKSWKIMKREKALKPVHFLKVSHHGSHNGTPDGEIFDALLPEQPPDTRQRRAYISSCKNTYGGIPHDKTNARLASRAEVRSTNDLSAGVPFLEAVFTDGA